MLGLFLGGFIFIFASIYIEIYNALYGRGAIHNKTSMAHKKRVEMIKQHLRDVCFTCESSLPQLLSE